MIHLFIDVLTLIFVFLTLCGVVRITRLQYADGREIPEAHDNSLSSDVQPHVIKREETFDQRIAQIKEELALRTSTQRTGHIADELDPNVKNLPHHTLDMQRDAEPEYAD